MKISNYCISGLRSLKDLPHLDVVQFTLNSRVFPSKRDTVSLLREMEPWYKNTDIIIHGDYIYETLSRFCMFNDELQNAIVKEMVSIVNYAAENPRIKGIIVHTDYPLKKDCYNVIDVMHNNEPKKSTIFWTKKIVDSYKSSLWDTTKIVDACVKDESIDIVKQSLMLFYNKFIFLNQGPIGCKIYLENTVHVGPNNSGTVDYLTDLIKSTGTYDLFGLCYDTEHDFGATGEWDTDQALKFKNEGYSVIVHLNTVPEGVKPKSGKDRHSATTVFECSLNNIDFYDKLIPVLCRLNIPWVREVKEDTMYRELSQIKEYNEFTQSK